MDLIENPTKSLCRVCGEAGYYDLCEMKFHYNDKDVMLIEAFNCFSMLNNVSVKFPIFIQTMQKVINYNINYFIISQRNPLKFIYVKCVQNR